MQNYHYGKLVWVGLIVLVTWVGNNLVYADIRNENDVYYTAMHAFNLKDNEVAQQRFIDFEATFPHSRWHWGVQLRLADLEVDPSVAEVIYMRVIQQTDIPEWVSEAQWGLAVNKLSLEHYEEAIPLFLKIAQKKNVRQCSAEYYLGVCYIALKQYRDAIGVLQDVIEKSTQSTLRDMATQSLKDVGELQNVEQALKLEKLSNQDSKHPPKSINNKSMRSKVRDSPLSTSTTGKEVIAKTPNLNPRDVKVNFAVQVGAFTKPEYASALIIKLKKRGYSAFLFTAKSAGGVFQQVRIGPFSTHEEADKFLNIFQGKEKLPGLIVPIQNVKLESKNKNIKNDNLFSGGSENGE